jgi:exportin-1
MTVRWNRELTFACVVWSLSRFLLCDYVVVVVVVSVYLFCSSLSLSLSLSKGPTATQTAAIRAMRSVKKETLLLVEMFVEKSTERELIGKNFMPPLLEGVLGDYKSSIPAARDPEVLSLLASIINRLRDMMTSYVPTILEAVLSCTLEMITQNFADYPTHRIHFFNLLRAINSHCFKGMQCDMCSACSPVCVVCMCVCVVIVRVV